MSAGGAPRRRSALDGHVEPARHGPSGNGDPGVIIEECRPAALVQVNGVSDPGALAGVLSSLGAGSEARPRRGASGKNGDLLWTGADQWWVVCRDREAGADEVLALIETPDATTLDLGHARTVVRVNGPMARDLLAKGCPLDVDGLEAGDCASSRLGPFNIVLYCRAADSFDLYVFRSFGLAMWEWLVDEAAEFGCEVRVGD